MPCDAVAVVRLRLEEDVAVEILASDEALATLRLWLKKNVGPVTHSRSATAATMSAAYGSYPGARQAITVTVTKTGGWTVTGVRATELATRVESFIRDLGRLTVQDRMVRTLAKNAQIESDITDQRGFRTLTLNV